MPSSTRVDLTSGADRLRALREERNRAACLVAEMLTADPEGVAAGAYAPLVAAYREAQDRLIAFNPFRPWIAA